mgnify:CR=1 FL=1
MSIRNLGPAFLPRSVALIGASDREGSVGRVVLRNVIDGGFGGSIYPVNPKYREVFGLTCYPRIADIPDVPDLAVIMTPPQTVPGLVAELGERGTRTVVVMTAGLNNSNGLRQAMLDAARPHLLRVIGPNTIGILAPHQRLNASFAHMGAQPGGLALLSQSGAIVSSVMDWAAAEGIGFSHILSLGDMADVDVGDCLDMVARDGKTRAILLYLESIPEPRKFLSAARAAARLKPVIAVKPGRHAEAAQAAATHTGALAGADRVIEAALRRAGIIRVNDLEDLFTAAEITARFPPMQSARMAIVTNGGGAGVLAVDHILDQEAQLASLVPETITRLDADLPQTWSRANPIDIIGDAPPERYRAAVRSAAADPNVDAVLVMNCPTGLASPVDAARAVAEEAGGGTINGKPILTCWLGQAAAAGARRELTNAGLASFDTPAAAAEAVGMLTRWSRAQMALQQVPESGAQPGFDRQTAQAILDQVGKEGRTLLTEPESKSLLRAYGIGAPEIVVAHSSDEVGEVAAHMLESNRALVVKLYSRQITHKSDVGGVVLNLRSAEDARAAAARITERVEQQYGREAIEGFAVQPMISRPQAQELIAGLSVDPIFGPVLLFGAGGTAVEVVDDTSTELLPIDQPLAQQLIDRTRISRLLAGYRDRPAANLQAIGNVLTALSQLAIDFPAIRGADINPLLADADGVIALDARIEIDPALVAEAGPRTDLSIRPYPSGWDQTVEVDGRQVQIRPIRPADARLYPDFLARVSESDLYMRFRERFQRLPNELLIRLTQLDYDRDIAFVALEPSGELAGIVRYTADPDGARAEFGLLVRSDLKRLGLGRALMEHLLRYARARGIGELFGLILRENTAMVEFATQLGFSVAANTGDPALAEVTLPL